MTRNLQYRLLLILVALIGSIALYVYYGLNLGLDLQGGIHLVLQVDTNEALKAEVEQVRDRLESRLKETEIGFTQVRVTDSRLIEVLGVPRDKEGEADREFDQSAGDWVRRPQYGEGVVNYTLEMSPQMRRALEDLTVRQVREIIQNRVDQYGVAENTITSYGSGDTQDQIIAELPGVEDFDRVRQLIVTTAVLELKLVHPTQGGPYPSEAEARQAFSGGFPAEYEILPYRNRDETGGSTQYMVVRKAAAIKGSNLKNARRSEDPYSGRSEVVFFLNADGVRLFSDVTEKNVNGFLAIVLDREIRSVPRIESKISGESARITGSFTAQQADDLALTLRSGALPAPITILHNRTVGPSLGLDSIRSGVAASLLGLALVVIGMVVFYKLSGINAIICLLLNLLFLLGALASFGATVTLPGIAGIILTIGMAVDANILIFERIKEELRLGKTVRSAVEAGFGRVFSTILDTNVTTLVAALFLFQFGTGPVKGFAVTLAIGLIANIFTATFVSKTLFGLLLQRREVMKLSI